MKIALVVHDFSPNYGHGRYVVELARRLALQHEVHIMASRFDLAPGPGWVYHPVPACRRSALLTILSFIPLVEGMLRAQPIDLIHAQGLSCWNADVITGHICNAARFQRQSGFRWRERLFYRIVIPLERRFYQQARARCLIAVSSCLAEELRQNYAWRRRLEVVYHGVDTAQFSPAPMTSEKRGLLAHYRIPQASWVWLFVGEASKGLAQVLQQLPFFPRAVLLVVSRSDFAFYRKLARCLAVENRVVFHGAEAKTSISYQAADVFLYPSNYDSFGMVVAEAMATELPVVVGQNIGAAEWITPRQNGLLCDPNRQESIREQLEWLQSDPARTRRMGQAARKTAQQHSWDACAAATEAVYEQVLAEKRKTP